MLCPICRYRSTPFSGGKDKLGICVNCRHVFWIEMPSVDVIAAHYAQAYTSSHDQLSIQASQREYYANHVVELASYANRAVKGLRVADIGSSIPIFAECAKLQGADVCGVDWSLDAHAYGADRNVKMFTPEQFEQEAGPFDVLRFSHVLEHLLDPVRVLGACASKLSADGVVYITQPNFPVLRIDAEVELEDAVYPEHLHFFSPLSVFNMIDAAGLKLVRFFSADNVEVRRAKYANAIDLDRARSADLGRFGVAHFGKFANSPYFLGANSTVVAIRRGAPKGSTS